MVVQSGLIALHHELGISDVLLTFAELFQLLSERSLSGYAIEQDLKESLFLVAIIWRRPWVFVKPI